MKKFIPLIITAALFCTFSSNGEGTKDLRPTSNDFGFLNPYDWGGEFATYSSPVDNRLNVNIRDHNVEKIYLGFNARANPAYFRVKRPDGTIISGPHLIPNATASAGYITDYAEAAAGPNKFNVNGYIAIEVDPDVNGDYYVEINQGHPVIKSPAPSGNGGYTYEYFDITVADTVTSSIKEGRVWAKQWALSTGNQSQFFEAKLYVLREDSIRFEVDYNGIDPYGFGIVSNSTGIGNTGDFVADRKSTSSPKYLQGTVPYVAEHKIFLNPPDSIVYPFPKTNPTLSLASSGAVLVTGCIINGYCINVSTSKPGQTEVRLDLDATPGYQAGGRDVIVYGLVGSGNSCVAWDGFDGLGDTALSANIEIKYKYEAGLIHIPIYDAENHLGGYVFTLLKNSSPSGRDTLNLYWDDTNFNSNPSSGINLTGCQVPCRNWVTNYGNERFLNSWSFAFDQTVTLSNVQFDFCPPEVNNDTVSVDENTSVTIDPLINDIATLNKFDKSTFQVTCPPSNGTFVLGLNQTVIYSPNIGYVGIDSICYTVCDTNNPQACRDAIMLINVIDINTPPAVTTVNGKPVNNNITDSLTTPEDTALAICIQWIEYEGGTVTATSSLGTPSHGTLQNFSDGDSCFTYVPDPNYNGLDTLRIVLCDNQVPQACDTLIIPIVITAVNDTFSLGSGGGVPIVNDTIKVITLLEDTSTPVCFVGTDTDGDSLDVTQVTFMPTHGMISNLSSGDTCFTYTPNLNYYGPDTVTVLICDNGSPQICDAVTVIFNVTPVNDPPVALVDTLFLDAGDTESKYVLENDSDVETSRSNLTFTITGGPFITGASASIVNDSIQYTAAAAIFTALDTVFYSVCDTGAPVLCTQGFLLISVPKTDTPPIAADDVDTTAEDVPVLVNILGNDIDPNLDPLTATIITQPVNGTAVMQNGEVLYTPNANYNGQDSLEYEVCDNTTPTPFCDTAWVVITVTPVNDNPNIVDANGNPIDRIVFNTNEDTSIKICLNGSQVDANQSIDITAISSFLNNGTVTGLSTGDTCFTYTPKLNFFGVDSLLAYVCDNGNPVTCDSITIVIVIAPVNDDPIALNDTAYTTENVGITLYPLVNDTDIVEMTFLDTASLTILSGPFNGSTVLNSNGTISYVPANGFSGKDSLQYEICDTGSPLPGECATAYIIINVDPINDPPVAVDDILTTGQNAPITIDVILNDSDPENDNLTVSILSGPSNGTINLIGSTLTYTPTTGFCGVDTVHYKICDDGTPSLCDSALVIITVAPQDDDVDGLSNSYETLTRNTDGDSKNDYLDIDSDNDGISDSIESIPVGGDLCNPLALDFDGDKVPDYLDPDSDNDGIPDWAERSGSITPPSGVDADNDGVDDAYDPDFGGTLEDTPVDTDNDGSPDFRDIDSDDDGIPDWIEGSKDGIPPSGLDTDGDGIDDAWDTDNGGTGLYGTPVDTDGDGSPDFRDIDSDGDGILDFDEKGPNGNNPVDTDGDGSPDFRDIDSDGDGISDVNEGDGDCDNDGIPDRLDGDSCLPAPPSGFSPNGDNVNDTYVIDPILTLDPSRFPNNRFIIYNRWGNKVYEKSPYDNSWTGESNSDNSVGAEDKLPVGTYYYIFDYGAEGFDRITGFIYLKQ